MLPRHIFSLGEWEEMGCLGLFQEDARVELIDGEIVDMTPIGARHQDCVNRLTKMLLGQADGSGRAGLVSTAPGRHATPRPSTHTIFCPAGTSTTERRAAAPARRPHRRRITAGDLGS
ncbi:MAG: Uma2 family endonuclease [Acidimicrobiales bacterium]